MRGEGDERERVGRGGNERGSEGGRLAESHDGEGTRWWG